MKNIQAISIALTLAFFLGLIQDFASGHSLVKRSDTIRCRLFKGFLCKWSCRAAGHSDGFCDEDKECRCSELPLENYVCAGEENSPGNKTADALCAGWCQFKGLQTGDCNYESKECACTEDDKLALSDLKCINDEVCSFYCQFKEKKATGSCGGKNDWDCICESGNDLDA